MKAHVRAFRNRDHIALTLSLYVAKWFCSLNGTFIIWTFGIHLGYFKHL